MATIIPRERADGTMAFRVQIVVKKNGKVVHRESSTFDKKRDADLWGKKRDAALSEPHAVEKIKQASAEAVTIKELIELYQIKVGKINTWGRSKEAVLEAWKCKDEGLTSAIHVDSAWLIDYCYKRFNGGAKPATINQDISFLRSVFSVAKDFLGVPVSVTPFNDARPTLVKLGLVGKGDERNRRPEVEEITRIIKFANETRLNLKNKSRVVAPIDKICVFAMFSARRLGEICRIKWDDLDYDKRIVIVRNMKDPRKKEGNDVPVLIPDEAWSVIESMPKTDARIFPYNSRSIGTTYERYRSKAGYYNIDKELNLRFHDLRHEALSWLAEKNGLPNENWDIPRLQMVSGHRNWNVLQRYVNLLTAEPSDRWKDWEWKTRVLEG